MGSTLYICNELLRRRRMEKMQADSIIEYYMRPMYGFALKKMGDIQENDR